MSLWLLAGVFVGAALVSGLAVAASIRIAARTGAFDHPDGDRKTQEQPIPRLGGLAVASAYSLIAVLALYLFGEGRNTPMAIGILLPAIGLALLGFADDRRSVNPWVRLGLQALAGVVAWAFGTRITVTGIAVIDLAILVLWVVIIINGINLLDNSDGLAASTTLVSAVGATIIAFGNGQQLVSVLGISLAGVALGFLWHNWAPASVYLGDAGAYFLGFMLAILAIRLRPEDLSAGSGVAVAVLLLILPIADTIFVVTRRLASGVHPFTAGRDHLSHVLQRRGHTTPRAVLLLQVVSILGVAAAILLAGG